MRSKLHQFVIVMENPGSRLSVFCFPIPSRLRLCVSTLVSVLWDFLSFVCAQPCGNVLVLWLYACWMSVGQNFVFVDADFMWLNIWFPPSGSKDLEFPWRRTRLLDLRQVKKTWYFTLWFFYLSLAHSVKSFSVGQETRCILLSLLHTT